MAARTDLTRRRPPAWALTRTAAAAVLCAVPVLVGSVDAAADPAVSVVFTTPAGGGAVLTSAAITLAGTVTAGAGTVESLQLTVQRSDGSGSPEQVTLTPDPPSPSYQWTWSPPLATNGYYTLDAAVTTSSPGAPPAVTTAGVIFNVNVPPAVPSGLAVDVDPATGVATLTWQANPEPDLTGYLILRGGPGAGAGLAPIAEVPPATPAFSDSGAASVAPGSYRYAVVALRWNSTGSRPDASAPSSPVSVSLSPPGAASAPPAPPAPPPAAVAPPRRAGARTAAPPASAAPAATTNPAGEVVPGSGSAGTVSTGSTVSGAAPAGSAAPTTTGAAGPSAIAPGAAAAAPVAATGASPRGRNPKLSSYELLDVALILSVVALLVAVGRDRRRRGDDDRTLRPLDILDEAGVGASMTIGDALAMRGAALEQDPGVAAEPPRRA
jgi:hypothetical protein